VTKQEAGRLGGAATFARHGAAHMAAIGREGFDAYARKFSFAAGGRKAALAKMLSRGKIKPFRPPLTEAEMAELYAVVGLGDDGTAEPPAPIEPPGQSQRTHGQAETLRPTPSPPATEGDAPARQSERSLTTRMR